MDEYTLYRTYSKDGTLLYVGQSNSWPRRMMEHRKNASWFSGAQKIEVEHFATKELLDAAERKAIIEEKPSSNIVHNGNRALNKTAATVSVCEDISLQKLPPIEVSLPEAMDGWWAVLERFAQFRPLVHTKLMAAMPISVEGVTITFGVHRTQIDSVRPKFQMYAPDIRKTFQFAIGKTPRFVLLRFDLETDTTTTTRTQRLDREYIVKMEEVVESQWQVRAESETEAIKRVKEGEGLKLHLTGRPRLPQGLVCMADVPIRWSRPSDHIEATEQ